jgi:membrane associated rhomboid family serine protease
VANAFRLQTFSFGRRGLALPPVTAALLAANALTFLIDFVTQRHISSVLHLDPTALLARPWTLVTYPLTTPMSPLWLAVLGYVFWWVGSSLERAWGSLEFGVILFALTVVGAVAHTVGTVVTGLPVPLAGLSVPLASVFIAWCMVNPEATVLFMFVVPLQARILGYLDLALLYFTTGPILGLFALVAPLVAWWYAVRGRRLRRLGWTMPSFGSGGSGSAVRQSHRRRSLGERLNPFAWYARKKRRREFERLMRISGLAEPDKPGKPNGHARGDDTVH